MTLASQIISDVTDVFLNSDEFAESVSYTPFGSSAKSINAVVEYEETVESSPQIDGRGRVKRARMYISTDATDGVATPTNKDTVEINSADWNVVGSPESDAGMWVLSIERFESTEKGARDHRINRGG